MTTSVLGVGAWLKNTACLWLDGHAHWSPLHGDLGTPAACEALEASVQTLLRQAHAAGAPVQAIAHDLHPDFFSTHLALATADALGVPSIGVQHHHAHLAAVLAAHGVDGPAVGLALDGVGLGTNGLPWGGELFWLAGAQWRRLGHLLPLALPGGDRAAREPWRMAAAALHALGRADEIVPRFGAQVGAAMAQGVRHMLERELNSPRSSSTGRCFDAAAGALGLCLHQHDEAQAAIALERAAARALATHGEITAPAACVDAQGQLDWRPLIAPLFDARDVDTAAAAFHIGLADSLAGWLLTAAHAHDVRTACLGGGCFFNCILRERVHQRLTDAGLTVLLPGEHGCGDAGLALGQAWVAARELAGAHTTANNCLSAEATACA